MKEAILSEQEVAFLKSLWIDARWEGILKKLGNYESLPRFSMKSDDGHQAQYHKWIYRSGGLDATDALIEMLGQKKRGKTK